MISRKGEEIDREIEDIKYQVRRELETIKSLMDDFGYRNTPPGWTMPFQLHRLRRALRIHYLALKIRETTPEPKNMHDLTWEFSPADMQF
ncbi:MAG: hypothetical protein GF411_11060 [Candidatus Lokiarchaeota archaeon]|nr:hypothetical protein [Candidatus Lokiarchaeota archaeon]